MNGHASSRLAFLIVDLGIRFKDLFGNAAHASIVNLRTAVIPWGCQVTHDPINDVKELRRVENTVILFVVMGVIVTILITYINQIFLRRP